MIEATSREDCRDSRNLSARTRLGGQRVSVRLTALLAKTAVRQANSCARRMGVGSPLIATPAATCIALA
jgi:hypothetical protein